MLLLETERLILRPFKLNDLDDFYEYCKLETVGPFAGWKPHNNKDESLVILKEFVKNNNELAIFHKNEKKVIGSIGLYNKIHLGKKIYEIGYVLSTPFEKKGLMTEALKEVIKYAFLDLNIDELYVYHFTDNIKSKRVIEKNNFKFLEKTIQKSKDFGEIKSINYSLKKEDYIKKLEE